MTNFFIFRRVDGEQIMVNADHIIYASPQRGGYTNLICDAGSGEHRFTIRESIAEIEAAIGKKFPQT